MKSVTTWLVLGAVLGTTACGGGGRSAAEDACFHGRDLVSAIRAKDFEPVSDYLRAMAQAANRSDADDLRGAVQEVRVQYDHWSQQSAGTADAQFASKWMAETLAALDAQCRDVGVPIDG